MKHEIEYFDEFIKNENISKIIIKEFSLCHVKEIELSLIRNFESELILIFNYVTHYCGNLSEWKNPSLCLIQESDFISSNSAKISQSIFALYDSNNNFRIKSINLYFEVSEYNKSHYSKQEKLQAAEHFLAKNNNQQLTTDRNIDSINAELALYNNCFISFPNSVVDKFIIQLEKGYISTNALSNIYAHDMFTKAVLIIECYGNTFFEGQFLNKKEASLWIQIKNNSYLFMDKLSGFKLECQDFKFVYPKS